MSGTPSTHLIITGSVATGKSYLQSQLLNYYNHLSPTLYPEFIYQDPLALSLLQRRFAKQISPLTFQTFILDKWEYTYQPQPPSKLNIYERLPDDAVEVFSKLSLSPSEYASQLERVKHFTLPKYSDMHSHDTVFIQYENDFNKPITKLLQTLDSLILNYTYIVIHVQSKSSYHNYKHRNRTGEYYTPEELEQLYELYELYMQEKIEQIKPKVIKL